MDNQDEIHFWGVPVPSNCRLSFGLITLLVLNDIFRLIASTEILTNEENLKVIDLHDVAL